MKRRIADILLYGPVALAVVPMFWPMLAIAALQFWLRDEDDSDSFGLGLVVVGGLVPTIIWWVWLLRTVFGLGTIVIGGS